jgi:hypothetical protein
MAAYKQMNERTAAHNNAQVTHSLFTGRAFRKLHYLKRGSYANYAVNTEWQKTNDEDINPRQ